MRSSQTCSQRSIFASSHLTGLLAVLVFGVPGCRSTRPSGSMVQVTEDHSSPVVQVDAPQQRLATTKVVPSQSNGDRASQSTTKLSSGKVATQSGPKNSSVRPVSATDDDIQVSVGGLVSASLSDLSVADTSAKAPVEAAEPPVVKSKPKKPSPQDQSHRQVNENSGDHDELQTEVVRKTLNPAPKVRRRPVNQTDQPMGLAAAIEKSLNSLPDLPEANDDYQGPGPKRIGVGKPSVTETAGGNTTAAYAYVTDDDSDQPSAQVQTVSHASGDAGSASLMASAGGKMVAEQQITEDDLYSQLLERIVAPKSGETSNDLARRQIIARYLMVLAGDPETATESMDGFSESEREFLRNQLMGLWTMIDPDGHPSAGRRVTEALPQFRAATSYLAAASDSLDLRHLEFCTEIESYGQIKPFDGNRFAAGQQVILYCEVENFAASEQSGLFQTRLEGSYDIYDASGSKVVSQLLPADQQRSRNRLRDYFVAYQMNLPESLRKGTYRLQLTLEDAVGKKYGQANIPFEIR
ncbi:hypothetical protein [Roseiconus lacunae]|uniref:Secreted protein n=1 Tax=Roseiconus lacunae TaxID=2605694 RepID=A0ABT7PIC9_9BACT|nr:hypothetical protein [Roseiconus lacunae]MDM4016245.1 hypothetical protein [Roseiconus lacunae]